MMFIKGKCGDVEYIILYYEIQKIFVEIVYLFLWKQRKREEIIFLRYIDFERFLNVSYYNKEY